MTLQFLFDRALETTQTLSPTLKQRIEQAASELSLAGHMQAHLDIAVSAMARLIVELYVLDTDQRPANVDARTGRILLRPLPWGESGAIRWGLRRWEGQCLRRLVLDRVGARRRLPALFDYNTESRQWHINLQDYQTADAALTWLKKDGPRLAEWRSIVDDYRISARDRMRRLRSGSE